MNLRNNTEYAHFDPWLLPYGPDTVMALRLAHYLGPMFAVRQWQRVQPDFLGQVWDEAVTCDWDVLLPTPMAGLATVCFRRKTWCWGGSMHARSMTGNDRMRGAGTRWIERIGDSVRDATKLALRADIETYKNNTTMQGWVVLAQHSLEGLEVDVRATEFSWRGEASELMFDSELDAPVQIVTESGTSGSMIVTDGTNVEDHGTNQQHITRGLYLGRIVYERQHLSSGTGSARRWGRESVQRAALRWRELAYARTDQTPPPGPQVQPVATGPA